MSKGLGKKIAIKFTEELIGDISGLTPTPIGGVVEKMVNKGVFSASNQYSTTYSADKAFDNSTSTYWQTRLTGIQWVQIELEQAKNIKKFRWYIGNSNRPNEFEFQGSNNGVDFVNIYNGISDNTTGWKEFILENDVEYKYYRWNVISRWSTNLDIYEIELYFNHSIGNEAAFTATGQKERHINSGDYVAETYVIDRIEAHPTELNTILLTINDLTRFNNSEGNVTISYGSTKGNLRGSGGFVESFETSFKPTDLIPVPNPYVSEKFTINSSIGVTFTKIIYNNRYIDETFKIIPNCVVDFIFAGIVNP